ncbi:MAG: AraC family transcriptional regulator [Lachnospiraceae bacterium]|nr:AraC family transcriptional regulator [Lachnospiraceae bacterium]
MNEMQTVEYTESSNFQRLKNLEYGRYLEVLDALTLCCCGIEQCSPRARSGPEGKEMYLVYAVLSGTGTCRVGDADQMITAGQAFLIRPGEDAVLRADEQEPWTYTWIGFVGYNAFSVVQEMGFSQEIPVMDLKNPELVRDSIGRILQAREQSFTDELRRKTHFYETVTHLVENHEERKISSEEKKSAALRKKYVRRAADYIIANYTKKIRISEIADEIGLNRSYLTNIFKKEMNMSPQDFLITFRLEKAAQLLRESTDSVRTIAYSTGYEDSLLFSKAFKQKYHMTPSRYRQLHFCLEEDTAANM